MNGIHAFTATSSEEELDQLRQAFAELHAELAAFNGVAHLVKNGSELWCDAIVPMLGRLHFAHGAWNSGRLHGFVAGSIRTMPTHLGGEKFGVLTHIHVRAEARGTGLGGSLLIALTEEFRSRGITHMQTDVLVRNAASLRFFEGNGFAPDHVILDKRL